MVINSAFIKCSYARKVRAINANLLFAYFAVFDAIDVCSTKQI